MTLTAIPLSLSVFECLSSAAAVSVAKGQLITIVQSAEQQLPAAGSFLLTIV